MDPHTVLSTLALAVALLAANAVFVTAEFIVLRQRRLRSEPAPAAPRRMEELLLTAQLGSSASTLLLGFLLGHWAWSSLALGPLGASGALALAMAVAALVHAVLGEQLPRVLAIHHSEGGLARALLAPVAALCLVLGPLVWPLTRLLAGVARNGREPLLHTPEEIRMLVARGHEQGVVEEDEREMIGGVFDFSGTVAREVMTPRIDIAAVPTDISLGALIDVITTEGHSRLPVFEDTIDAVVGVLLAKDLIPLLADGDGAPFDVQAIMREPYFVPDTKPVDDILAEFRQLSVHLAIVLDEFGGTYGLVTMEDLLEEIVGEINDEYDVAEPEFSPTPEGDVLIDGGASISEVNERFGLELSEADFDTLGGFIFGALGRLPVPGDEVTGVGAEQALLLHVEETEDRRVTRVRLMHASPGEVVAETSEE